MPSHASKQCETLGVLRSHPAAWPPVNSFPALCTLCLGRRASDVHLLTPCSIIDVPLPTHRLASAALRALQVDAELSPLVHRTFSLAARDSVTPTSNGETPAVAPSDATVAQEDYQTILRTEYKATTNRMLRVAVNGFMESLSVVLGVMENLDVDVLQVAR